MAALASTRVDMCQTPQQTAEMNPSHSHYNSPLTELSKGTLTMERKFARWMLKIKNIALRPNINPWGDNRAF